MSEFRRVAVLGAGVMGTGIACHLANAGIESLLYDIVPEGAGGEPPSSDARNALALRAIAAARRASPAPLFRPTDAARITPCNYEDHADLLESCDWIVEVVVERLDIKQDVYAWVAEHRSADSIVTSNTSGIKLADMAAGMPEDMRSHFLITHFFNPVRYMRLLELVVGPDTSPAVAEQMARFGDRVLGKGVVWAKDTPNFIANRIGTYGMAAVFRHMAESGLTVEQVDAIFGEAMARPSSAVFRTADMVGLDTLKHVFTNLYEYLEHDEEREIFKLPPIVDRLLADGRAGAKSGAGFYKKIKEGGKSVILSLDFDSLEYKPTEKVRYPSTGAARKARREIGPAAGLALAIQGDDDAAKAAWRVTADTLIYTANRIPEIADDIVNVDRAMRWGFGWELGPFQMWDAIGVPASVARMEAEGRIVPAWIKEMLAAGRTTFYARDEHGRRTYHQRTGGAAELPVPDGQLFLSDVIAKRGEIAKNSGAALLDLGDGVLGLEFRNGQFLNALNADIIEMYGKALDELEAGEWEALVIGNQHPRAFSAGADLASIGMAIGMGAWDQLEAQIAHLQRLVMRAKYAPRPVITTPHGLTLGGGCEVAMHSAMAVATAETYMGLVEAGMGLIPGAGGCKELIVRYLGDIPQDIDYDPNPFVQKAFERIGLATPATSAGGCRDMGFLRSSDRVSMNIDRQLFDAKAAAVGLAASDWVAPQQRTVKLPGPTGAAAIELFLYDRQQGGFISAHDAVVGRKLAYVLTGGDIPWGTVRTEQDLLDLEREAFLSLAGEPLTQARIAHFAQTGKVLRN
ncbi:MAG TPA: 3-hydroxyacyl-CoA dehydrogenase/enoyl-CoA hydratase family protein [Deltaproteobacteria bacterium]|nr:3-hydroxyacyl-CoA dehydrogenase/enoyl-CoA hydratase family protein [Deltaproteobacteria bacterium]